MNTGEVTVGLGLAAYGAAFLGAAWWWVGDDDRLRRAAVRRWWFDRRVERRIRLGQLSRDEWLLKWSRGQRFLVRRVFPVLFLLWFVLTLGTAIRGFQSG